jgi:bacterioferritin-associated ferredoxin
MGRNGFAPSFASSLATNRLPQSGARFDMIICSCNVLSEKDVKSCMLEGCEGALTPAEVHERLGSTPQCGCCTKAIRSIVRGELRVAQFSD